MRDWVRQAELEAAAARSAVDELRRCGKGMRYKQRDHDAALDRAQHSLARAEEKHRNVAAAELRRAAERDRTFGITPAERVGGVR